MSMTSSTVPETKDFPRHGIIVRLWGTPFRGDDNAWEVTENGKTEATGTRQAMEQLFNELQQKYNILECAKILQEQFNTYNETCFCGDKLPKTEIMIKKITNNAEYDAENNLIKINQDIITGDDEYIDKMASLEGRDRFVSDCLLHEMIHKYCHYKKLDMSGTGHEDDFQNKCNEIAKILQLEMTACKGKEYNTFPLGFRSLENFYKGWSLEFSDEKIKDWRDRPDSFSLASICKSL